MLTPAFSWLARRRLGAAEALNALSDARDRYGNTVPPKVDKLSIWTRILIGLVSVLVLAGTATIGVVVVGTQIGFYRARMGTQIVDYSPLPIPAVDLAVFTPLATEGVAWMCTAMAVILVWLSKPAGIWTRSMWAFSAIAAFVNAYKAAWVEHDVLGGIVTGGLSIAGPYVVHLFVIWVEHVRTGRTVAQVRIDTEIRWATWGHRISRLSLGVLDVGVHPVTAVRSVQVWRAFRGITYAQAWVVAARPVRERILDRYRDSDRANDPGIEERFLSSLHDDVDITAVMNKWTIEQLGGREPGPTSGNTITLTPDAHPEPVVPHTPHSVPPKRVKRPWGRESHTAAQGVQEGVSKQERVIGEYWRRRVNGDPVEGVNMSQLARALFKDPATRPTVSKVWKACLAGKHPKPNGDGQ